MTNSTLRAWIWVHKWTSLICTLFMLMLCITGLPLVFHDEIDRLLEPASEAATVEPGQHLLSFDAVIDQALAQNPGHVPLYLSFDENRPFANVTTGPRADAGEAEMAFFPIDRRTGEIAALPEGGVMDFILQLHTDMFLGMGGLLFLGAMGLLFFLAIVSGVIVYAPFMRRIDFATVRRNQSRRTKWLDYHNLLGIVTLAWAAVVGLTGTINTLSEQITTVWRADTLAGMIAKEDRDVAPFKRGTADRALNAAMAAAPGMRPQFVAFPGVSFSSSQHLAVFLQGATPLNKKLLTPVLVNARTGKVDAIAPMPWYMQALLLSQPLHFGDYGGMPMKLLWALLDIVTIVVLGSGLYLWWRKGRAPRRLAAVAQPA